LLGLSLVAAGAELAPFLRKRICGPILRLAHHLTLVALGVFGVLTVREAFALKISIAVLPSLGFAAFVMLAISLIAFGSNWYIHNQGTARLETLKTYKWLSIVFGFLILVTGFNSLQDVLRERDHKKHEQSIECPSQAPSIGDKSAKP
jgi:voltage-gated potassium channel Kch